ncbi:DUF4333 domain-containing protein [Haloechinothrix alba]|uniref:DUF4333 domain-containing protein n=1 Tax=Haloechinothrix alba TaxID=664784 RepID=UPI001595AB6A|nr:DUF4333 domain-containing protein [Haloechinothrix alba]
MLGVLALSGCAGTAEDTVTAEHLEVSIVEALDPVEDGAVRGVDCQEDLRARFAEMTRCTARIGDERYDVKVLITSVEDGEAEFDIDREPTPKP